MGACMANSHRRGSGGILVGGITIPRRLAFKKQNGLHNSQILFSKEQSMLLDMWNEKHIEMLKTCFNQGIGKKQVNSLDYSGFLRVFDHTKREGHEKGPSILQMFGPTICKQAFRLFDSSRVGTIVFRDFCCALSIICLGGSTEKIRFLFDLFDLDRDGFLSRRELTLLLTQVINIWICPENVTKATNRLRQMWVELQLNSIQEQSESKGLDFLCFKQWAETQIDIYRVLSVFELVPSPWREHDIILQVLDTHKRKHGDSIYALSYRWWDSWKEYTEKHASTLEAQEFVNKVRETIASHAEMPDELKRQLLYISDNLDQSVVTPKVTHNIKGTLEKQQWGGQVQNPEQEQDLSLSFSMRQQMVLVKRRTSTFQQSAILVPTPRKTFSIKMSQASLYQPPDDQTPSEIEEHQSTHPQSPNKTKIPKSQVSFKDVPRTKSTFVKPYSKSSTLVSRVEEDSEHSSDGLVHDQDLILQMKESLIPHTVNSSVKHSNLKKTDKPIEKLKSLVNPPRSASGLSRSKTIESRVQQTSTTSLIHLDESKLAENLNNFGNRPLPIDNSDIEGEHPGQLQLNLIMYRDFVTIPEEAWNLFCHWYGQAQQSPVFSRKVLMHNSIASMELYPPRILCVLADRDGKPIADSQKALFVSTSLNMGEVHLKICELFNYISTRDTRLWVKGVSQKEGPGVNNEWTLVQDSHHVKDGDVFMVEVKFYGNQWPMDVKSSAQRSWKQFEIGDKLDVKDGETWKIGCIDKVNKDTLKIHLVKENYKNDLTIRKDSDLLAQFGQHTLSLHFKDAKTLSVLRKHVQGIKNIGNTCYMNACLQTLLHTPLFSSYFTTPAFKSFLYTNAGSDMISEAFALLMKQQESVLEPVHFKKAINTSLPLFYGNQQQDSAEFFNFMLDKMNEEMNRTDKKQSIPLTSPTTDQAHSATQASQSNSVPPVESQSQDSQSKAEETGEVGGTSSRLPKPEETKQAHSLLSEQKKIEDSQQLKVQLQQKAINEAKQTVYDEFFQKPLNIERSVRKMSNQSFLGEDHPVWKASVADSFNPNISDLEAKAKSAWFSSLKKTNSPVSDLFVGQQTTEVTCLKCQNKSHTFENFYSLPIPLPANNNTCFYIHIVRWQRHTRQHPNIIAYGVQLQKYLRLVNLVDEIKKLVGLADSLFIVCEMGQNRIYRVHEDAQTPLYFIAKRTNILYFYEHCPEIKQILSTSQRPSTKGNSFHSFDEIQPGMLVDAMDQYFKWYVGLVIDKEPATETTPIKICVHFYQLHQKFDEWFEESSDNFKRLRPLMASGQAEQPKDSIVKLVMIHRKVNSEAQFSNSIGLPYCVAIPNWVTWRQFHKEISMQVYRHLQAQEGTIPEENLITETDGPLISTTNFDHKSKKHKGSALQSPNILNFKSQNSDKRLLEPLNTKYTRLQSNSNADKVLSIVPEDISDKYFKIKLFCAETNKCAFCTLKVACKQEHEICKNGCDLPMTSDEQIKYTFSMFKQLNIMVDWNDRPDELSFFKDVNITHDSSYLKYKKQESEVISGIPLAKCLDLYSKKEKIEGYHCDNCKANTNAVIKPLISHLPDVLVLHLKRFNFVSGYLDKIEDLVTFPLQNLDMSKYLIQGARASASYDLYAIVNHHMYQTGGHYTAAVQIKTEQEPIWVWTNDAKVSQIGSLSDLVKKDAYMLYYKRKELTPSNIIKLTHQL